MRPGMIQAVLVSGAIGVVVIVLILVSAARRASR